MGKTRTLKMARAAEAPSPRPTMLHLSRARPRAFAEWQALRRWGKLPLWERAVAGYLLREAREQAGLTQKLLGEKLGVSQQAVAQAERWSANPTVEFMRRWADACGSSLDVRFLSASG
jgi:DNA-binding XRE family transcriptional regulator